MTSPSSRLRMLADLRLWLSVALIAFQYWILMSPQQPLLERPVHLLFALVLAFLWFPLKASERMPAILCRALDWFVLVCVAALAVYLYLSIPRFMTRIDNVSPVFWWDVLFGIVLIALLIEAVRRTVGWILVWVIVAFLLYGAFGYILPGEAGLPRFRP